MRRIIKELVITDAIAQELVPPEDEDHAKESWVLYYRDNYPAYYSTKEANEWFPTEPGQENETQPKES
jgi:hypothetical protein